MSRLFHASFSIPLFDICFQDPTLTSQSLHFVSEENTISYHTHLLTLSLILTRAIAETLLPPSSSSSASDLIESSFMDVFSPQPHARMKIVRYPCVGKGSSIDGEEAKPKEGEFGVGAHRDGGGLTILQQDDIGGLQVQR